MNKFFNLDNRKKLQFLLSDGFSLTIIQKKLDVTRSILYTELMRGLTAEEYKNRQYVKYNLIRAIITDIEIAVGKDSWDIVKEAIYEKRDL
ncbi:MAG: hypothetical protein HXL94_00435 [[Eubacterium] sulci]|jgi:hypothetical protein|nr:hypothetical protein [[Eubacterium] sulci]MBF1180139.1 hypothetical protein [[Eubacterium] sulci]DAP64089.1 MAG TPA: hypothetical protein [Caudoviricetes sp.]